MEIQLRVGGQRFEEFFDEFDGELADRPTAVFHVIDESGPAGEIDRRAGEGFVHGDGGPSEAGDAAFVAECFFEALAQDDADVFDGVVRIDLEIPSAWATRSMRLCRPKSSSM